MTTNLNTIQFLGTGGSLGVPVIGCTCDVCQSRNAHNFRTRPGALLTLNGKKILIDAGPDFRTQALEHQINEVDGVIITHAHHDHTAGIDDLRIYTMRSGKPLPCLMSDETFDDLRVRYHYIFDRPKHPGQMTSKLEPILFPAERGEIQFLKENIQYFSYEQAKMKVSGIRVGRMAYVTDIKEFPETLYQDLSGVNILIISALRYKSSNIHFTIDDAVNFAGKIGAKTTWLTHISHEIDHDKTNEYLPLNVRLAYDGLELNIY